MKNPKKINSITLSINTSGKEVIFTNLKESDTGHYLSNKDNSDYTLWNPFDDITIGGVFGYKKLGSNRNTYCKVISYN
jgi:hypothetical protein